jgi:DNA-binding transcriptional ArsR family regulator
LPPTSLDRSAHWALAHPLRLRLYELLRDGPATASQLARRIGESRGLASYHLRMLERAGAIAEDASLGTRRERWWRRASEAVVIVPGSDTEGRAVDDRMLAVFFARDDEIRHRFVAGRRDAAWQESAFVGNWFLTLTPAAADELGRALFAVVDEHRRRPRDPAADDVLVTLRVLPVLAEE